MADEPVDGATASITTPWPWVVVLGVVAILAFLEMCWWVGATLADWKFGRANAALQLSLPSRDEYRAAALKSRRIELTAPAPKDELNWFAARWPELGTVADNWKVAQQGEPSGQRFAAMPVPSLEAVQPEGQDAGQEPGAGVSLPAPDGPKPVTSERKPHHSPSATIKPHKLARPYYVEKLVEQGDAGEVAFRYRRRNCTPDNMVDVCFMPRENRRNIVVEHY